MKRKLGTRSGWRRILAHRYTVAHASGANGGYVGVIALYSMQRVAAPLWKPLAGQPILLADDGFAWLQFYPSSPVSAADSGEAMYSATAMIAPGGAIAQWYVDICAGVGLTPEGVPWHDDLYLDLITTGRGDCEILDAHELDEALEAGAISLALYQAAWRAAHSLAPYVRRTALPEMRIVQRSLAALRALERDERDERDECDEWDECDERDEHPERFDLLYHYP